MNAHSLLVSAFMCGVSCAQRTSGSAQATAAATKIDVGSPLQRALAAARTNGLPVLVFVVAPECEARRCESRWLADLLALDESPAREDLALVEIAFATRAQLAAVLPTCMPTAADAPLGLIDIVDGAPRWTPLHLRYGPWCGAGASDEASFLPNMRAAAAELRTALVGDPREFERRVESACSKLSAEERAVYSRMLANDARLEPDMLDRAAWLVRSAIERGECGDRGLWRLRLALRGYSRVVLRAPFGARWFVRRNDHIEIAFTSEDDETERARWLERIRLEGPRGDPYSEPIRSGGACVLGPCGTGFAPQVSYRFLDEYVRGLVMTPDEE